MIQPLINTKITASQLLIFLLIPVAAAAGYAAASGLQADAGSEDGAGLEAAVHHIFNRALRIRISFGSAY